MGMLNESILHWGREQARALTVQSEALDRNFWISGASKFFRLVTQIVILGGGAYLALQGELTGGMMIAASIIAGRALQPLEGMIEGWRSVVQTRARLRARQRRSRDPAAARSRGCGCPSREGRLTVDKLLYMPPGSKEPVLNGVSFELAAGRVAGDRRARPGSGKSTLARILVGCLMPTAGKVRLDGTELRNWDRRQFGEFTGYLPQEVELFPGTIKRERLPHARRPARRDDLRGGDAHRRARHDLAAAAAATRPCSSAAARRSRAARSSASRWPAPSSAIRRWWCWTSPTPISMPRASRR